MKVQTHAPFLSALKSGTEILFLGTVKARIDPKFRVSATSERFLTASLGVEFGTRRRNEFAGFIGEVNCFQVRIIKSRYESKRRYSKSNMQKVVIPCHILNDRPGVISL